MTRLHPTSGSGKTLIIGDSGEASLLAALSRATDVSDPDSDLSGDALWVRSVSSAHDVAHRVAISRALVDLGVLRPETISIVDARGVAAPVRSVNEELERRLGRVHPNLAETAEQFASEVPSPSPLATLARRTGEIVVASVILLVMLPCLLIFSAIYRVLFGETTFLQRREVVGKGGELLTIFEYSPTPLRISEHTRRFRLADSIRRNIHRTHLNGVPVLVKALLGELALVGPTPIDEPTFKSVVAEYPVFAARTLVRTGIISLARVRLKTVRTDYDLRKAIEYDLFYVKHQSLWLDARILGRASIVLVSDVLAACARIVVTSCSLIFRSVRRRMESREPRAATLAPPPMPPELMLEHGDVSPALIIGAGAGASLLLKELQRNKKIGLWPVAVVDDNARLTGTRIQGVPVLGTTKAARAIVDRERIKTVVIAVPSATPSQMERLVQAAQETDVPVLTMPGLGQIIKGTAPSALISVPVNDLLGRPVVNINPVRAQQFLGGKRVLVTGAVGSIGREVVIQALRGEPATIYGMDINESDLYDLQQESKQKNWSSDFVPIVGSVCDSEHVGRILRQLQPEVVFHAAAYKHVPLMEDYPHEAVRTNIGGTWTMARASARAGVERFVMVSTDKAVNPTSVMGATKRIAELLVQDVGSISGMSTCSVRFGNVLGSRGSVIPLFERQIESGGPVTITDPGMLRYFMTIPEAAGLIIEAGAFGDRGVVYMLDMGEPVRIVDLANRLIELKGLRPGTDIDIRYTGLRPGEKLFEELSLDFEQARPTAHPKIRILDEGCPEREVSAELMAESLFQVVKRGDPAEIRETLLRSVHAADQAAWMVA